MSNRTDRAATIAMVAPFILEKLYRKGDEPCAQICNNATVVADLLALNFAVIECFISNVEESEMEDAITKTIAIYEETAPEMIKHFKSKIDDIVFMGKLKQRLLK